MAYFPTNEETLKEPLMQAFAARVKRCCGAKVYVDRCGMVTTDCQHFRTDG